MKERRYKVTYTSKTDDDCCSVWTTATSKANAIADVKSEYWDVKEIICCTEMN